MTATITYQCDSRACGKRVESRKVPAGWMSVRGFLLPGERREGAPTRPVMHFCAECRALGIDAAARGSYEQGCRRDEAMTTTFTFDLTPEGATWVSHCRELGITSAARNQPSAIKACVSAIAMAVDHEMRRSGVGSDAALEAIALRCKAAPGIGAAASEAPSAWRASPPVADDIRGGRVYWWVHPPGGAPYPVELYTRGDAIVEIKSGLPIEHWQMEGTRWAPCVPPVH